MRKEHLIAFAESAEAGLTFICSIESMLRTFTMTGEEPTATEALLRKPASLVNTEFHLL